MPKADNASFVLSDFIFILHSPFTGVARAACLPTILRCTMAALPLRCHEIVTKIMVLIRIYRDSSPCVYCVAISAKIRRKNYLVGQ
jgi:hypothetical protein